MDYSLVQAWIFSGFILAKLVLLSVATDGKDGNGLKLENIGPIFSSFGAMSSKIIIVSSP